MSNANQLRWLIAVALLWGCARAPGTPIRQSAAIESTCRQATSVAPVLNVACGQVLTFSGGNYVEIQPPAQADSLQGTWSIWIRTRQFAGATCRRKDTSSLIANRGNRRVGSAFGVDLFLWCKTGTAGAELKNKKADFSGLFLNGGPPINDGIWHLLTFTFDGQDFGRLYVDGANVASGRPIGPAWHFNHQVIRLAVPLDRWWTHFVGELSDFRIYDRILPPGEIRMLYLMMPTGTRKAPVGKQPKA